MLWHSDTSVFLDLPLDVYSTLDWLSLFNKLLCCLLYQPFLSLFSGSYISELVQIFWRFFNLTDQLAHQSL